MPFLDDNKRTGKANAAASQAGSDGISTMTLSRINLNPRLLDFFGNP